MLAGLWIVSECVHLIKMQLTLNSGYLLEAIISACRIMNSTYLFD